MVFRVLGENEKERWNNFLEECEMGNIYQSYEWSIEMQRRGWSFECLGLEENNLLLAGTMLYWQKLPLLNKALLDISFGPVWNGGKEVFKILCEEIIKIGKKKNAVFLEFQIYLPETINRIKIEKYQYINDVLLSLGFERLLKRDCTYRINLDREEDELLNSFEKNNRRDIRKAEREGVKVKIGDNENSADIFYQYYSDTLHRKDLVPIPRAFFDKGLKSLLKTDKCIIFYAEYQGKIYNMALISLFGNPAYVFGGSIRSDGLPPMGEFLHWEIIKWLKAKNYKLYDLGGSPGEMPQKGHPNYWVWRFKEAFNGDFIENLPYYRYTFSKSLYWLYDKTVPFYRKYFSGIIHHR